MSLRRNSIGVVLCTYNGERFLSQQLESIQAQTRPPDEILILDDCSSDHTVSIVNDFAKRDERIRLIQNDTNLGYARNFEKGILLCEAEYIALSDQDDIWFPEKLDRLATELETNSGAGLVFCNGEYMLADGTRTGHMVFNSINGSTLDHVLARRMLIEKQWSIHGNFMLLDAQMKNEIFPNPIPRSHGHDSWICLNAFFLSQPRYISEPLSLYRLHGKMASGAISNALKGTEYELRKKWYDPRRLAKNLRRAILSPFRYYGKKRERKTYAYNTATDMLYAIDRLLERRKNLGLPELSTEEMAFLQQKKDEWTNILTKGPFN